MNGKPLSTSRLKLIPATFSLMQAELGRQEAFSRSLGARIPANWPPELRVDALPLFFAHSKRILNLRVGSRGTLCCGEREKNSYL